MSRCFGCAAKFGIFKREHACRNCGKAFCSSCLTLRAVIPPSTDEQQVCKNCHKNLERKKQSSDGGTSKKSADLERVELPEPPPPYSESKPQVPSQKTANLQPKPDPDAEIRQRLAQLKEKDNDQVKHTDESIAERFLNLTGRPAASSQKSDILTPRPKLSEQEEIDRLMDQAMAEANLSKDENDDGDVAKNSNKDIENRLLLLKGIDPEKVKEKADDIDSSEDEEESAARILKQALAEAQLDDKAKEQGYGDLIKEKKNLDDEKECGAKFPSIPKTAIGGPTLPQRIIDDDDNDDELPWCCICNADATLRCHGCDDDLYCKRCYREGHSKSYMDIEEHRTSIFRAKKKK